jgi:hypothetical protein
LPCDHARSPPEIALYSRSPAIVNTPIGVHGRYILLRAANVRVRVMYLQKLLLDTRPQLRKMCGGIGSN